MTPKSASDRSFHDGIAQGREVEQRLTEAEEVLGEIVDRRRVARGGGQSGGGARQSRSDGQPALNENGTALKKPSSVELGMVSR